MINVTAIDHVVFRVKGIDRVAQFYIDVIGARLEKRNDEIGLWQLRIGASLIDLVPVDGVLGAKGGRPPEAEGHNVDHVCLRVSPWNEDAIRAHLSSHGIDNAEIVSRYGAEGDGPSIYLDDPEGNVIELKGPPWPPARDRA
ncbi:VOC family protein [Parasphingopyxis algicola]|uniref:VOC family protein n=1 Tax=Parasphingopyxis algicola TaxID=2026624 RepID=UPI00159FADCF|nr:VOC family protein [Parasphingopyxis algicola]QLC24394.1 VOC family protein [Parasphingopyxis algicola]